MRLDGGRTLDDEMNTVALLDLPAERWRSHAVKVV
jgi:hypothetical protein